MIFIDRSIPKSVAQALQSVRNDVEWFEPRFSSWTKDSEWLPIAGDNGWLVILRDKRIRTRAEERQMIIEHGVGAFVINQGRDPTRWEYLKLLASTLDDMIELFQSTPRPFIYTVSREGRLNQVLRQ